MSATFNKEDLDALLRAFFDTRPMTDEEADAAKAAMEKMSPWQGMTWGELDQAIRDEEKARLNAAHSGGKDGS